MLLDGDVPVTSPNPSLDSLLAYSQLLKSSGAVKTKCEPTFVRPEVVAWGAKEAGGAGRYSATSM